MKRAHNIVGLYSSVGLGLCIFLLSMSCGCVTRQDRLLQEILEGDLIDMTADEADEPVDVANPDAPEAPIADLPDWLKPKVETLDEPAELTIQPDSVIEISVEEDAALSKAYMVNNIGAIDLQYLGPVFVGNLTVEQTREKIEKLLESRYVKTATVAVKISKPSYDKIAVYGEVMQAGVQKIGHGATVSLKDALLRAGRLKPQAKGVVIKVVRNGYVDPIPGVRKGEVFSLVDEDGKIRVPNVMLRNNDLVYVLAGPTSAEASPGEKEIIVLGEVHKVGPVRFRSDEPCTVMRLYFKMGGLPKWAKMKAIKIIRTDENGIETEMEVNMKRILEKGDSKDDVQLENGDRVIVEPRRIILF